MSTLKKGRQITVNECLAILNTLGSTPIYFGEDRHKKLQALAYQFSRTKGSVNMAWMRMLKSKNSYNPSTSMLAALEIYHHTPTEPSSYVLVNHALITWFCKKTLKNTFAKICIPTNYSKEMVEKYITAFLVKQNLTTDSSDNVSVWLAGKCDVIYKEQIITVQRVEL